MIYFIGAGCRTATNVSQRAASHTKARATYTSTGDHRTTLGHMVNIKKIRADKSLLMFINVKVFFLKFSFSIIN